MTKEERNKDNQLKEKQISDQGRDIGKWKGIN